MYAGSVLIEQLEENGLLKTVKIMQDSSMGDLVVGFPDDYDEPREGSFHFVDKRYEEEYQRSMTQCKALRLGRRQFSINNDIYSFRTWWRNIPVGRSIDSSWPYYALFLPEFGIPIHVSVTNPLGGDELQRYVYKDEQKGRFSIYVQKFRSKPGEQTTFDFDLTCDFRVNREEFLSAVSPSEWSGHPIGGIGEDLYLLQDKDRVMITNFINTPNVVDNSSGTSSIKVFFSYSHKDESLRDILQTHLTLLQRDGVISEWHDRRITAGKRWGYEINEHLNTADVVLLLVSADFIASDYCFDIESKRAMERHESGEAIVIPIILRPCDWHTAPFAQLQSLPKDAKAVTTWANQDEAFTDIAQGIRKAAIELSSSREGYRRTKNT